MSNFGRYPGGKSVYGKQINTTYCHAYLTLISFSHTHRLLTSSSASWHTDSSSSKDLEWQTPGFWELIQCNFFLIWKPIYISTLKHGYPVSSWTPGVRRQPVPMLETLTVTWEKHPHLELHGSDLWTTEKVYSPYLSALKIFEDCCAYRDTLRFHVPTAASSIAQFLWVPITQDFF